MNKVVNRIYFISHYNASIAKKLITLKLKDDNLFALVHVLLVLFKKLKLQKMDLLT